MPHLMRQETREFQLEQLREAAHWYEVAIAQSSTLLNDYDLTPFPELEVKLIKDLQFQKEMMDDYAEVFSRCMLVTESAEEGGLAKPAKRLRPSKRKPVARAAGRM